jgi:hypothetical protein
MQVPPVSQLQYNGAQLQLTEQQYNCSSSSSSIDGALVVGGLPTITRSSKLIAPVVVVAHDRPDYLARTMGHLIRWVLLG